MADFCLDCARRFGLPEADIAADPGTTIWDVCEGCGPGWFDENGKRVSGEETTSPVGSPGASRRPISPILPGISPPIFHRPNRGAGQP